MNPEEREECFGDVAQRKGYISWPQLREALEIQIEKTIEGKSDSLVKYCMI